MATRKFKWNEYIADFSYGLDEVLFFLKKMILQTIEKIFETRKQSTGYKNKKQGQNGKIEGLVFFLKPP